MRKGLKALLLLSAVAAAGGRLWAQTGTLCATVKLEIAQEATLEREAFDARLTVFNNLPDTPLTSLKVQVFVNDSEGNPVDGQFFVKLSSLTGTNAVDGSGVVQSSSSAEIRWLIIPSPGAGGTTPGGKRYGVSALITAVSGSEPQNVRTFEDLITVFPQPLLKLEYVLPYEVFADEPLTAALEPVEPFPLGVQVTNVGFGTAKDFKIDSAQPKIVENKLGLQIDFRLLGTVVGGRTIPDTLLVPFGDIPAGGVGQASWVMATTLSGRFIEFTSTFTHAAELGGDLTSLLQSVTTYTLVKDVLVETPGRDAVPDFLVNASLDRGAMQDLLDSGGEPPAELILESDQPVPIPVLERSARLEGSLGGVNAELSLVFDTPPAAGSWVHASVPFPYGGTARIVSARRADGTVLNLKNAWISKHFRKSDLSVIRRLHILDLASGASSYALTFDAASLDAAPGAVTDLAARTGAVGGALSLSWTAPGEDGFAGGILGGRYLLGFSEDPLGPFTPGAAQVSFTTSTAPGRSESATVGSLVGNTTFFARLWTQDTGGAVSEVSNAATAYALPRPPKDLVFDVVGSTYAAVSWQVGNNRLPVLYQVFADTDTTEPFFVSSPEKDSFDRAFTFTGLSPETTYFFLGRARNPDNGALSELAVLGSTRTAVPDDRRPPRTVFEPGMPRFVSGAGELFVSTRTALSFRAEDDRLAAGDGLGRVLRTEFALDGGAFAVFAGTFSVSAGTYTARFFSVDEAGNTEEVKTSSFTADGAAPATVLLVNGVVFSSAEAVIVSTDELSFVSTDAASGVLATIFTVDGATQPAYSAPFSLSVGTHVVAYFSLDRVENAEGERSATFFVRAPPPPSAGDMAMLQVVGLGELSKPHDAAAGPEGKVYAADTNNDRIAIFAADGSFLAAYGMKGRKIEPHFGSPHAVDVDADGNIFVADTRHHRIVKLSAEGALLLEIGDIRVKKGKKQFHAGDAPGQFRRPKGIAVGTDGKIYVSDTGNRRVQVFNPNGSVSRVWDMPETDARINGDDEEEDEDEDCPRERRSRGVPFGIAVDASGGVYVADAKRRRAAKFSPEGELVMTIGSKGRDDGEFGRPEGIAVSTDASAIWVSDRQLDRVQRFSGAGVHEKTVAGAGLKRPTGLALTADGFWVADRNNNRLARFGPAPEGFTAPAAAAAKPKKKHKHALARIERAKGGRVIREDGARVEVPEAALEEDEEITVSSVGDADPDKDKKEEKRKDKNLGAATEEVEYGPEGLSFAFPVTISIPYDPQAKVNLSTLKVHYWNPQTKEWEPLPSTVDTALKLVSAKTSHFSLYQGLGTLGTGTASDPNGPFGFGEVYAYPNPARGQDPKIRVEAGSADKVEVRIYDIAGELKAALEQPGPQGVFEFRFGAPSSGVYIFVVTASKAGQGSLRRTGRLAVIK